MDKVIIEGVRCFVDRQVVPLRPLTVLVGENSSGKSTFLALTRIAWDLAHGQVDVDFNEEPVPLGSYEHVASRTKLRGARTQTFTIGCELNLRLPDPEKGRGLSNAPSVVESRFSKRAVQPTIAKWIFQCEAFTAEAEYSSNLSPIFKICAPSGILKPAGALGAHLYRTNELLDPWSLFGLATVSVQPEAAQQPSDVTASGWERARLGQIRIAVRDLSTARPYAFAPIRTQPQRTYDPLKAIPKPEGSHVPMILARLHGSDPNDWAYLKNSIEEFGKKSGLLTRVDVRRMGKQEGDPFQVVVNVASAAFNLVDVGYGVSQILPIIVDILRGEEGRTFLLQQPEVHLHPRAQAELGTFLATVAKTQKKRFVVETHSDYIVDRIRMDVRDRKILKAEDVIILYFERASGKTTIHPIEIDEFGNLKNVPKGYRDFFLQEERRFLEGEG